MGKCKFRFSSIVSNSKSVITNRKFKAVNVKVLELTESLRKRFINHFCPASYCSFSDFAPNYFRDNHQTPLLWNRLKIPPLNKQTLLCVPASPLSSLSSSTPKISRALCLSSSSSSWRWTACRNGMMEKLQTQLQNSETKDALSAWRNSLERSQRSRGSCQLIE